MLSSGQRSWLQIQRSEFDFRRYQIFWEMVGLERGPLSLVSTIEELFERNSSVSGLKRWEYGRRDLSRWPRGTLCQQKLALTSPASGRRSVGIVRSRTRATQIRFFFFVSLCHMTTFLVPASPSLLMNLHTSTLYMEVAWFSEKSSSA
jgi:hypothetical protein